MSVFCKDFGSKYCFGYDDDDNSDMMTSGDVECWMLLNEGISCVEYFFFVNCVNRLQTTKQFLPFLYILLFTILAK